MAKHSELYVLCCVTIAVLMTSCVSRSNTAISKWYHGFTTRYNVLYNGEKAFDQAYNARLIGSPIDFFTLQEPDVIPVNETSDFNVALQKADKAISAHSITTYDAEGRTREGNPILYKAWLLKGKSLFYNGDFSAARDIFARISDNYGDKAEVSQEAWLFKIRCDIRSGTNSLTAKELIEYPAISNTIEHLHALVICEYYLQTHQPAEAIPYLKKICSKESNTLLKSRYYYLTGQLYESLSKSTEAYTAFREALHLSPPFNLLCAAEVKALENAPVTVKEKKQKVEDLLQSPKYNQRKSLIYIAKARLEIASGNTTDATTAYKQAVMSMDYNDPNLKQVNRLIGDLYLEAKNYQAAWQAYSNSNLILSPGGADTIEALAAISENLEIIHKQDSLLQLASLSASQRDSLNNNQNNSSQTQDSEGIAIFSWDESANTTRTSSENISATNNSLQSPNGFYFNDPVLVERGKLEFKRKWGNRKLQDFWQQSRRSQNTSDRAVIKSDASVDNHVALSPPVANDSSIATEVPHTPQAVKASEDVIIKAYLNIISVLRDRLRLTDESIRYRQILERRFPDQIPPPTP